MRRLAISWIVFLLLWLIFVFQVTPAELMAGAIASALTTASLVFVLRIVPLCFQPRLRWLIPSWRLPVAVLADLWLLFRHLARAFRRQPSRSSFDVIAFPFTGDGCHAAAQRMLALLFVSLTPNSVVFDIGAQSGEMLVHRTEPSPDPTYLGSLEG